jgi:hypothetical protein
LQDGLQGLRETLRKLLLIGPSSAELHQLLISIILGSRNSPKKSQRSQRIAPRQAFGDRLLVPVWWQTGTKSINKSPLKTNCSCPWSQESRKRHSRGKEITRGGQKAFELTPSLLPVPGSYYPPVGPLSERRPICLINNADPNFSVPKLDGDYLYDPAEFPFDRKDADKNGFHEWVMHFLALTIKVGPIKLQTGLVGEVVINEIGGQIAGEAQI